MIRLLVYLDVTLFNFESDAAIWSILGMIVGGVITGGFNYFFQNSQFKHNKEMFYLENQSKVQVKEILTELLNHRTFVDRSFDTIRKRIGGYNDNELRLLLHEVGAKKSTCKSTQKECWYLKEREDERNRRRNK